MADSLLTFRLLGQDVSASKAIERVGLAADATSKSIAKTGATADAAAAKASAAFLKVGKASAIAVAAFAAYGVDAAAKFQKLTNVYVTAAGESQKDLKTVQDGVLKVAENTGTAWQEVAAATYTAEKAGYRAGDAYKVVEAAAQGAKEENANLATVTNAVTSIMASYHLKATDAVKVTDELKAAAGESKVNFEDFSGALSTVLPLASAAHISFADVAGAFATLTQHGTSANESTQELAATIRALTSISPAQQKAMAQIGLSANDVSQNIGTRGLTGTVNMLSEAVLKKMGPSGTVLLNTFNQSKQASADAQTEFDALSPAVQKLATQFEKGQISAFQYGKDLRGIGGEQGVLGKQFLTTYTNAKGFQDTLKQGLTSNKTYTAEIKALTGGAIGLNTVLQLTGESTKATAARVKTVSDAAKNAGTSVSGWASTQKLFSTQLDEFKQRVEVAAIRLGQDLLPVLTKIVGVLARHPGLLQAAAVSVGVFAAAWTAIKIGNLVAGLGRLAAALLTVGTAARTAAVESAAVAGTGGAAAASSILAEESAVAGAGAGAAAAGAASAARGGLLSRFPLLKIAIPIALTYTFTSATGLNKELSDIIHGQFKKAASDAPKWAQETADAISGALAHVGIHTPGGASPLDKFLGNPKNTQAIQSVSTLYGQDAATSFANALRKEDGNVQKAWQDVYQKIGGIPDFFTKKGTVDGQAYGKSVKSSVDATLSSIAAVSKFQDTLRNSRQLLDSDTNSLDGNTAGAVSNRKGLQELTFQAVVASQAYEKSTGHTGDFTRALALSIPQILDQAQATGLNRQQTADYINTLLKIPGFKVTTVGLDGTAAAQAQVAAFLQSLAQIPAVIRVPVETFIASPTPANQLAGSAFGVDTVGHHATGGIAKGWALVGERGPELMHVGSPSAVIPAGPTRTALGGVNVTINMSVDALDAKSFQQKLDTGWSKQIASSVARELRSGFAVSSR